MSRVRSRLAVCAGVLGFALAGFTAVGAPAQAGPDVSLHPSCSIRTQDYVTAEASCVEANALYEYRIIVYCKINMAEGYFYDYAIVSEWTLTTRAIRVPCDRGGALIVGWQGPEFRPSRPV
jgi:hypothetical protein